MPRAPEIVEAVVGYWLPGSEDESMLHIIGAEVPGSDTLQSAIAVRLGPDPGWEHSVTVSEKSPRWEPMGASPSDFHNPTGLAPPAVHDTGDTGPGSAPPDARVMGGTGHGLPTLGAGARGAW